MQEYSLAQITSQSVFQDYSADEAKQVHALAQFSPVHYGDCSGI